MVSKLYENEITTRQLDEIYQRAADSGMRSKMTAGATSAESCIEDMKGGKIRYCHRDSHNIMGN